VPQLLGSLLIVLVQFANKIGLQKKSTRVGFQPTVKAWTVTDLISECPSSRNAAFAAVIDLSLSVLS
jgi:hypothetical protein